ncbi:GNAT family N-acetyltransferase [Haloferax namakaokahaiae]|uniref:GNAT family N-acetyltransferase n=1 Tax=Haloferax namakaokahaiae TaxID=1748331 RepID=A0ABD5ZB94_9EURY
MGSVRICEGYVPGVVGRLTELHATYYGALWDLGPTFERDIAEGIAAFVGRYQSGRDGLWTVIDERDTVMGGLAIDSRPDSEAGAQLRYFILHPSLHGQGLGQQLLDEALAFCDRQGFERVFLWTVDELEAAVHLYEKAGFEATDEIDPHTGWRTTIPYRLFERRREW